MKNTPNANIVNSNVSILISIPENTLNINNKIITIRDIALGYKSFVDTVLFLKYSTTTNIDVDNNEYKTIVDIAILLKVNNPYSTNICTGDLNNNINNPISITVINVK